MRVVALPESDAAVKLSFDTERRLSLEACLAFCRANPDLRVERTAEGEIVIMPPAGYESSFRSLDVAGQLREWALKDGRGNATDSSAEFILPDGSALSPDAFWVSKDALHRLPRQKRKEFPPLAPEFVVEVMSPNDRLKTAKEKMEAWIANGVPLAWLIDGDSETVHIYRKGHPPEVRRGIRKLAGESPVKGFVLQLSAIWKGLA
jgi:Uma2 family endonuclease